MNPQPMPATPALAHQQAQLALRPRIMEPYLARLHPVNAPRTQPACHVLDAKYEPGKQCAILYAVGDHLMIGELRWENTPHLPGTGQDESQLLAMQVYPYERDPALPGLTTVLDDQRMAEILNQTLPDCVSGAARILRCQVTPLRYRLGKRCTVRLELRLRATHSGVISTRTLYGKLYHSSHKAQAVYEEMQQLSASPVLRRAGVTVADAVAFVPQLPMVIQAPVDGVPLDLWFGPRQPSDHMTNSRLHHGIRQTAAALAALHQAEICTERPRPVAAELERFQRRSAGIRAVDPRTGGTLAELAHALPAWLPSLPAWGAEETLVHGDCKPSQFFITPGADGAATAAILDFDHCGVADPAADVGNFLASLRQVAVRQRLKGRALAGDAAGHWSAPLEQAFLSAYVAARPCPAHFAQRAAWYEAVALLRKGLRAYGRSPRSPLPAALVQEAWRCLAALPQP
jgi:aminoglycoside phosphotransferase (APT) family kinase protein